MSKKKRPRAAAPAGKPAQAASEREPIAERQLPAVTAPAEADTAEKQQKAHRRRMRALRELLIRIAALLLVVYVLFFHLVGLMVMPGSGMYPRVDAGDLLLFYRLERNIRAQDIIVFRKPTSALEASYQEREAPSENPRPEKSWQRAALDWLGFADPDMTTCVCRVVAGPGDTVEITAGERLVVNGNTMVESNIFYSTPQYAGFVEYPLTLGPGEYFVLGDARSGAEDSRFFGPVTAEEIVGTVITILRRNQL